MLEGPARLARSRLGYRPRRLWPGAAIDVAAFVWLAWVFDWVNDLAPVRQRLAEHHATQLLSLEHSLHLAPELTLNRFLGAHHALSQVVVLYYENVHAGVTFAVLAWLWWHRPDLLAPLRATLVVVNLVGMAAFWAWPTAPPRMLVGRGYLDLVAADHHLPVWHAGWVSAESNQLASLPSLHLAWAAWCTLAVWRMTRRRWIRAAALAYPLLTAYAVMATGNHFLADCVAGALATVALLAIADRVPVRRARRRADPSARLAARPEPVLTGAGIDDEVFTSP